MRYKFFLDRNHLLDLHRDYSRFTPSIRRTGIAWKWGIPIALTASALLSCIQVQSIGPLVFGLSIALPLVLFWTDMARWLRSLVFDQLFEEPVEKFMGQYDLRFSNDRLISNRSGKYTETMYADIKCTSASKQCRFLYLEDDSAIVLPVRGLPDEAMEIIRKRWPIRTA